MALPGESLARFWSAPGGADSVERVESRPGARELPLLSELPFSPNLPPDRPVSKGAMASAVGGGLHLIRRGDGVEELYDIVADPFEQRELMSSRGATPEVEALRAALQRAGLPRRER